MTSTPTQYFTDLWDASADPWDHAGRWYEHRKYDLTVAVLPNERYRHAVEPACGVGLVTERLARRADHVSASDRFPRSAAVTETRCAGLSNVTVAVADVRDGPSGPADLVVLGEVLYYFDQSTVRDVVDRWAAACERDGHVVLVHHRPTVDVHVLTGDEVHALAIDVMGPPIVSMVDPLFLIDVFAR